MQQRNVEARQERGAILKQAKSLSDKGNLNPRDQREFDRLMREADDLKNEYTQIESQEYRRFHPEIDDANQRPNNPKAEEHRKAFGNYLKLGPTRMDRAEFDSLREHRDLSIGGGNSITGPGGSYLVPVGFQHDIEVALKTYSDLFRGGPKDPRFLDTTTGQPLPYPTSNDTSNVCELVGEGQQVTTADMNISAIQFGAFKFSSKLIKVSLELLQDSAFDIQNYLTQEFAIRMARGLSAFFTTGTGSNQPMGILTAAAAGVTFAGAGSNDGSSAANTVGSDDLINLEHSVDPLYRGGAQYMFADSTLQSIKKIKDKYGRPIWMPSLAAGEPATVNGYGYLINNSMPQLQANVGSPPVTNKTILFGDMHKFVLRRVRDMSILRLEERFADYGQVAFLAFSRWDSQLLDAGTNPVKYGQNTY